jgi:hypothetical protein
MYKSIIIFTILFVFVFFFSGLTAEVASSAKISECCTTIFSIEDTGGNPVTYCWVTVSLPDGTELSCYTGSSNECKICVPKVPSSLAASASCAFNLHGNTPFNPCAQSTVVIVVDWTK